MRRKNRSVSSSSRRSGLPNQIEHNTIVGINPVYEALRERVPSIKLLIDKSFALKHNPRVSKIMNYSDIPHIFVPRSTLDRLTDLPHQGVALLCKSYRPSRAEELLKQTWPRPPLFIACDQVTDPRNLGAIVRSAAAFRASAVLIGKNRSARVTPMVWKASAGAVGKLPIAEVGNLTRYIVRFREYGGFVLGLDSNSKTPIDKSVFLKKEDKRALLLIVGSEGRGISHLVKKHCDELLTIPTDASVDSLNVSVAVSIALYELQR